MKLVNMLSGLGTSGISDQEDVNRIRLTNRISFVTAFLMILIAPVLIQERRLFIPLLLDFSLKLSVLFFNLARKPTIAKNVLFYTQVAAIGYFGWVLAPILQLEYVVVLLIAVNYYIFRSSFARTTGLILAIADLLLIEYAHYKQPFNNDFGLSYNQAFMLHFSLVLAIFTITILVIIAYAQGNDLRFKLERANTFIKLFINTVTHELRTPINALSQTNHFLKKEIRKDSPIRSIEPFVNIIENASSRTIHIINNVLTAAKIEAGRPEEASRDTLILIPYFTELIGLHQVLAEFNRMRIECTVTEMPQLLVTDQFDLSLIVSNLLSNAIKYGEKGGTISVEIARAGKDQWMLKVSNPGRGIPPEKIGSIFDPFVSNRSGAIEGTGLGLYIVKTKVDAMQGTITVHSKPDHFTQFTVVLPLREGDMEDLTEEEREQLQPVQDRRKVYKLRDGGKD